MNGKYHAHFSTVHIYQNVIICLSEILQRYGLAQHFDSDDYGRGHKKTKPPQDFRDPRLQKLVKMARQEGFSGGIMPRNTCVLVNPTLHKK